MSDRLQELLRQKALLEEQTTWIEREIARERAQAATPTSSPSVQSPRPSVGPAAANEANPEALLDRYRQPGQSIQQEVRRGCLLYFFAALALVGLAVLVAYLSLHRR